MKFVLYPAFTRSSIISGLMARCRTSKTAHAHVPRSDIPAGYSTAFTPVQPKMKMCSFLHLHSLSDLQISLF
jgi:hypothetical protein